MDEFKNSVIKGIFISQYIAAWIKTKRPIETACRCEDAYGLFIGWLKSLVINGEHLTDDEVWRIYEFTQNGNLELDESAKRFLVSKGF